MKPESFHTKTIIDLHLWTWKPDLIGGGGGYGDEGMLMPPLLVIVDLIGSQLGVGQRLGFLRKRDSERDVKKNKTRVLVKQFLICDAIFKG